MWLTLRTCEYWWLPCHLVVLWKQSESLSKQDVSLDSRYPKSWSSEILWTNNPRRAFPHNRVSIEHIKSNKCIVYHFPHWSLLPAESLSQFFLEYYFSEFISLNGSTNISFTESFFCCLFLLAASHMLAWSWWPWWCVWPAPLGRWCPCPSPWCWDGATSCTSHGASRCSGLSPSWSRRCETQTDSGYQHTSLQIGTTVRMLFFSLRTIYLILHQCQMDKFSSTQSILELSHSLFSAKVSFSPLMVLESGKSFT